MIVDITVFTPTYNRADKLTRLYKSIVRQKGCSFEWVVIDDGSTDGTKDLVEKWMRDGLVDIKYFWQENGGKMQAQNRGAKIAVGELFVCIDSDDALADNALLAIVSAWKRSKGRTIGVVGLKIAFNGDLVTTPPTKNEDNTLRGFYEEATLV